MAENKSLEIVRAISRAVSEFGHDGACDSEGQPIEIGLKREEGNPIIDSREIDGFKVSFHGNKLIIKYQAEEKIKDVKNKKLEDEVNSKINDIAKFIRKEAKKHTDSAISLTPDEKSFQVVLHSLSSVRSWVEAKKDYTIGGLEDAKVEEVEDKIHKERNKELRNWIEDIKKAKRPENEKIKASDNERENLREVFNVDLLRRIKIK